MGLRFEREFVCLLDVEICGYLIYRLPVSPTHVDENKRLHTELYLKSSTYGVQ